MAYEIPGFRFSLPAAAALTTDIAILVAAGTPHAPRFVSIDSSGEVDYTVLHGIDDDMANAVVGVIQDDPSVAGEPVSIMATGISKVEAGTGGVTVGQRVATVDTTTSGGRIVDVTANGDNQIAVGIALETAAAGEFAAVLLMTPGGNRNALS